MSIPQKMHGLILKHDGFSGTNEGPSIESLEPYLDYMEVDVPKPNAGQVLIKVALASINPSDLHFIKGEYGLPRKAGVPAGFEAVGEVVKAGEGAEGLIGKRVGFFGSASGVWAGYAISEAAMCVPVRDDVRDEDAAALLVNPMTAIGMYEEAKKNDNQAFIMTAAASQLCKLIAGLAKEEGMPVISIVRRDEHVESLKEYGSTHVLNSTADGFADELKGLMKELKPRVMLDAVADQTAADIFTAMPSGARWIAYGKLSPENPTLTQMGQFIFMGKHIEGFWLTQWMKVQPPEVQMGAAMKVQEMFATGKWQTDVADTISIKDAHEKLPAALSGINTGKVFLRP